jgi:hypothetical protein
MLNLASFGGYYCCKSLNIQIQDKKGSENVVADHLSRITVDFTKEAVVQILILASARIVCNIVYVQVRDRIHREMVKYWCLV